MFIGIQVSNWNGERQVETQKHLVESRLAADEEFIKLFANADLESQMIVTFGRGNIGELVRVRDKLATLLEIDTAEER